MCISRNSNGIIRGATLQDLQRVRSQLDELFVQLGQARDKRSEILIQLAINDLLKAQKLIQYAIQEREDTFG